ncbi:MAG TPA: ROK family protein, partial [Longimicrobiales bacterium]
MTVVGIDVGGTKIAAALFREDGTILARHTSSIGGRAGREVGALIRDCLAQLGRSAAWREDPPRALGAIVPGIYWSEGARRGRVWAPNIPGWDDYPLLDELRSLAGERVAVAVDSDRAGYILGEAWLGAARGARDAIFVAVGTGIGAGILVNGQVLRGARDIAGATGWLALNRPYRAGYREVGCFEYNASGPGIVRVARDYLAEEPELGGVLTRIKEITTAAVFEAAEVGDALAIRVIENAIAFWGMAVANYISLFDPEIVIFGGGVFGPAARYLDQ